MPPVSRILIQEEIHYQTYLTAMDAGVYILNAPFSSGANFLYTHEVMDYIFTILSGRKQS
jgi:hypothetical protein